MSVPDGYGDRGAPPPGAGRPGGTNALAVVSLILGITWLGWIGSVLAIIFGHVSLAQIKRTGQSGRGMAVAGLVLGYIGVAIGAVLLVFVIAIGNVAEEKQTQVVLEATGSGGAERADITYSYGQEVAQANGSPLPWRKSESRKVGGFDLLQMDVQNTGETGAVTCRIIVDGKVVARNTSSGPFAVATCSSNRLN